MYLHPPSPHTHPQGGSQRHTLEDIKKKKKKEEREKARMWTYNNNLLSMLLDRIVYIGRLDDFGKLGPMDLL